MMLRPRRRVGGFDREHFVLDDRKEPGARMQYVEISAIFDA